MADLSDFSSFPKDAEKTFVPFERTMRENRKRAFTIGAAVGGAIFLVGALSVLFLYTPCTTFCQRPPSGCESEADIAKWKANCESACAALEHESGLQIAHEITDDKTGEVVKKWTDTVDGTTFIKQLSSCAFSGSSGATCESVTKVAEQRGLWCAQK